jgi:hypothetical protein
MNRRKAFESFPLVGAEVGQGRIDAFDLDPQIAAAGDVSTGSPVVAASTR